MANLFDYYKSGRNRRDRRDMYGLKSRFDRPGTFETPDLYGLGGRREEVGMPVLPAAIGMGDIPPEPGLEPTTSSTVSLLQTLKGAPIVPAEGIPTEGIPATVAGITPPVEGVSPVPTTGAMPSVGTMPSPEGKTPLTDYWKQPVMGKMGLDQFVSLAGMLASAIAPREPAGRMGAGLASMAMPIYRERVTREAEAAAKVPTAWETYYKENVGKLTSTDLITGWHKLKTAEKDPTFDLMTRQDPVTKKWQKGYQKKGTTEFLPIAPATPAEIKKAEGVEKAPSTAMAAFLERKPEATPEEIATFSRSLKALEKVGWFTADVDGKPKRIKQTAENVAKYNVWKKLPKEKEANLMKIADRLYSMQFDKEGNQLEEMMESDIFAIQETLKGTDYEIINKAEPGEIRSLLDIKPGGIIGKIADYLRPDKAPEKPLWVLQRKPPGAGVSEAEAGPATSAEAKAEPTAELRAARILKNKKTGEIVHLDSQGRVIKREVEGVTKFPIRE